jgi:hypothetical protein
MAEREHPPSDFPGRRSDERFPLNADVEILEPISASGVVINASANGLRIAIDKQLEKGTVCVLAIRVEDQQTIEVGRVAWSREFPDGFLVGLSLVKEEG